MVDVDFSSPPPQPDTASRASPQRVTMTVRRWVVGTGGPPSLLRTSRSQEAGPELTASACLDPASPHRGWRNNDGWDGFVTTANMPILPRAHGALNPPLTGPAAEHDVLYALTPAVPR